MDNTEILVNSDSEDEIFFGAVTKKEKKKIFAKSDSEDEIFFGAVTKKEKKKAHLLRNRKTEIFEAPLRRQSVNMAPHDDAAKTYSKVPNILTATVSEKKQRIKQRPPPLPPFTQLYCTKDRESPISPFHLLTNTKNQLKTLGHCLSKKALMPLLSPQVLSLPVQQLGRLTLSPGLSESFYYDPFDKLLRSGHVGTPASANISPCQYRKAYSPKTSCSSVEDILSPAGLLFCSPMPQKRVFTLSRKQNKLKAKKNMKKPLRVVQSDYNMQENGQQSREHISNKESTKNNEKTVNTPTNINIYKEHNVDVLHTPDLFFTSAWITRRQDYEKISLITDMDNNESLISSIEKAKLKRSFSVPQIHVLHPEESDNSFMSMMSPSFTTNPKVLEEDSSDADEEEDTTTRIPVPTWLLTMASALNNSPLFSESDLVTSPHSPLSDLGKTFDTVSTLTPIFSKHISNIKKPLSTMSSFIVNPK